MAITSKVKKTLENFVTGYFVPNESKQIASGVVELFKALEDVSGLVAEEQQVNNDSENGVYVYLSESTTVALIKLNCSQNGIPSSSSTTLTVLSPKIKDDSVCIAWLANCTANQTIGGPVILLDFNKGPQQCTMKVANPGNLDYTGVAQIAVIIL
jgi:hypothetical protein